MGMCGYLHRVPADRLLEFLANPGTIAATLYAEDQNQRLPEATVGKSWNAIEFILDRLPESRRIPRIGPLTGGRETGTSFYYGPCWYRTPEEVKATAAAIGSLSQDEFRKGYIPEVMARCGVYPDIWEMPANEENFQYVWVWFVGMVEFYREAAALGEGMLLHLG